MQDEVPSWVRRRKTCLGLALSAGAPFQKLERCSLWNDLCIFRLQIEEVRIMGQIMTLIPGSFIHLRPNLLETNRTSTASTATQSSELVSTQLFRPKNLGFLGILQTVSGVFWF